MAQNQKPSKGGSIVLKLDPAYGLDEAIRQARAREAAQIAFRAIEEVTSPEAAPSKPHRHSKVKSKKRRS